MLIVLIVLQTFLWQKNFNLFRVVWLLVVMLVVGTISCRCLFACQTPSATLTVRGATKTSGFFRSLGIMLALTEVRLMLSACRFS